MRKYTKENGKLPRTDFEQGDIVVYEGKNQKDIIVLDDIYEALQGDIFFKTILVKADNELPYLKHLKDTDYRNWFNGDTLRDATADEIKELLGWLLPFVPEGLIVDSYNYRKTVIDFQEKLRTENPKLESEEINLSDLEKCRVKIDDSSERSTLSARSELEEMKKERDEWQCKYEEEAEQTDKFVAKVVEETKLFFKHDRKKADVVRQIMIKVDRLDAEKELDDWIEGREVGKKTIGQLVMEQNNYGVVPPLTTNEKKLLESND